MTTVTGERRQPAAKELAENERSPSNGHGAQDATPAGTLGAPSHKLWGGRFSGGPAPALEAVNRSIGTDYRLWPFDIRLSKAWAVALWNAGILTLEESRRIEAGLDAVATRFAAGEKSSRDR
jgi:argininosuccinate lyase